MAMFKTTIVGTVLDVKVSKKGKRYLKVYDGDNLQNVFVSNGGRFEQGEEVVLPCLVFADQVYIKHDEEGGS